MWKLIFAIGMHQAEHVRDYYHGIVYIAYEEPAIE
jgi:hypothetical protein